MEHEKAPIEASADEAAEFNRIMGGGIELEEAEKPQESKTQTSSDVGGVPGINLIQSLITASFFHDMFCRFAYSRFTHVNTEDRVTALASQHKLFYRICRYSDYAYRAIAAVAVLAALVAIAGGAILKIFYPHLLPSQG